MATAIDDLLAGNGRLADSLPAAGAAPPSRRVAIVTCMDARIDLSAALGLAAGEAHVLRNAGGIVTDDVIRSLAISQRRLGTRETMLVHHTECGMEFPDIDAAVRDAIRQVRDCDLLPDRDVVRGFVYDVATHRLREVGAEN
jgi:carbonic anhydrase